MIVRTDPVAAEAAILDGDPDDRWPAWVRYPFMIVSALLLWPIVVALPIWVLLGGDGFSAD